MSDFLASVRHLCPVRPANSIPSSSVEEEEGFESIQDAATPAFVDRGEAIPEGDLIDADDDSVVQPALCLPCPKSPSAAQVAAHNVTHMPYRSWCPHCVASRRPNTQHRSSSSPSDRSDPLLVADYCFIRDSDDETFVTVLVARLYPSRAMLSTVVNPKGPETNAVARLARFIHDSGYSKIVYRSDQEVSILALFEETFKVACHERGQANGA